MAEGALFDLAGNVLQLLGSVIVEEVKLASSVETEIENLTDTVTTIRAVLLDAEMQSSHNHQIKVWLRRLKDVLHDADDLLDDFSTEVMRIKMMTKKVRLFSSCSNPLAFSPKMGREIKAIREKLNAIAKDKEAFHFSQSLVEPRVMTRGDRETYSFVLEDEVIGREDDKKEIMERLFDDNVVANISIIPIVGFGGLGKTTLAQLVYNDKNVQTKFEIKLWVCISDVFDVQRIVKEILEHLTKRKHEGSIEMLQTQLREELDGKKYLIVLDDLWNEESNKWLLLRNLLMGGAKGSRIIVTTRSENVARIIGATSWHALRGLPEEKAWSLFVKMAFENGQLPKNEAFVSLGRDIMGKCGGVPLAIRTIASLLYTKATENEWRSFKDYELSKITQDEENVILSTLKLSYNHLPSYLKQCFAYCRLFPKDYKIDVTTLINLWAAQAWDKKWDDGETECYDDMSLEGLQPHPNLKGLDLSYYMGVRIPSWVSSLTNLVHFRLSSNKRLQHLPPINQLPFLKVVFLHNMKALKYISDEDSVSNVLGASSSSSKTPFFPSLSSLRISNCPKLKGWWRNSDDNEPHHLLLPSFPPSLLDLQIEVCPNLTSMPLIPDLTVSHIGDCPLLRLHEGNSEDCPK
uniref:Disease resistance protein RGA3 n=1 Tax=Quercus lobata TaxID=97700 RepID=A0A7N2LCW5_QUELO